MSKRRTISRNVLIGWAFLSPVFGCVRGVSACPVCNAGLISSFNPQYLSRLAEGYYWSILLLLTVPFTLVGTVALLLARNHRRRTRGA